MAVYPDLVPQLGLTTGATRCLQKASSPIRVRIPHLLPEEL